MHDDVTLRIRMPHRPGTLSKIAAAIGKSNALIGDLTTIHTDSRYSLRDVTIEQSHVDIALLKKDIEAVAEGIRVDVLPDRARQWHEGGKLRLVPTRPVTSIAEMRLAYTPGVARICTDVANDDAALRRLTWVGKTVLVLSDGSRVLGLGDLGARGVIPVLEGKALFYVQFTGINAIPLAIECREVDAVVALAKALRPNYVGIHLEDIAAPRCFELESRLQDEMGVPVLHDDRHGTAVVAAAAVLSALRTVKRDLSQLVVGQIGLGAAGYTILELLIQLGPKAAVAFDPSADAAERVRGLPVRLLESPKRVMEEADLVVAATGKADLIQRSWVKKGQIVFALTNPIPEIKPDAALAAGAALASEGSMINNVLAYPGLMRGAIDANAVRFTPAMKIAGARALAERASGDDLLPSPFHPNLHMEVAAAVAAAAQG